MYCGVIAEFLVSKFRSRWLIAPSRKLAEPSSSLKPLPIPAQRSKFSSKWLGDVLLASNTLGQVISAWHTLSRDRTTKRHSIVSFSFDKTVFDCENLVQKKKKQEQAPRHMNFIHIISRKNRRKRKLKQKRRPTMLSLLVLSTLNARHVSSCYVPTGIGEEGGPVSEEGNRELCPNGFRLERNPEEGAKIIAHFFGIKELKTLS
jgi:hypothetical protein